MVISGYHTDKDGNRVYEFYDPATQNHKDGTTNNTLTFDHGQLKGSFQGQDKIRNYTVTQVRLNN